MAAALGLGTYRCRNVAAAARAATAAGVTVIDTAPVYAHGTAHAQLARLVSQRRDLWISTKVGHMTRPQARAAHLAGVITSDEAARCHSISPGYLEHQIGANADQLRRERLELMYLHNPEHGAHGDRNRLLTQIRQAFEVCEEAAWNDRISGYGVATWTGFASGAFSVQELLTAARDAAGSQDTHLAAIQFPVNLVQLAPLAQTLGGTGPITEGHEAGLQVWASAPLSGGELAHMVTDELADMISPGLPPVAAALAVVASTPGLTGALLSASTQAHWRVALSAFQRPPIPPSHLQEICRVLRT